LSCPGLVLSRACLVQGLSCQGFALLRLCVVQGLSCPDFVLPRVCPVQGLSCQGFVLLRVCRVQGLSCPRVGPVQGLSCPGFSCLGLPGLFLMRHRFRLRGVENYAAYSTRFRHPFSMAYMMQNSHILERLRLRLCFFSKEMIRPPFYGSSSYYIQ
jgi:hypothetical protein